MDESRYIGHFCNKRNIEVVKNVLNAEYPNVRFSLWEDENGHDLFVSSLYGKNISYETMINFKNNAWILYKSIPIIQDALKDA